MWKRPTLAACGGSAALVLLFAALAGLSTPSSSSRLLAAPPPTQEGTGTIKGRLVWGGDELPNLPLLVKKGDTSVKDTAVCSVTDLADRSLVVDPSTKGVALAFAYLASPKGATKKAAGDLPKVEIDQKNCEFIPRNVAIHQDQTIIFKSSDPVAHNVRYSGFVNSARNIALPPNGSLEGKLKAERRPLPLNCDIHPWMKGWIMVFDHPYYAVTAEDGSFEIKGVPAGTQNLVIWQERVGYATEGLGRGQPVTVQAGQTTDVGTIVLDPAKVK